MNNTFEFYIGSPKADFIISPSDSPRWVTFDASNDWFNSFSGTLTDGKDYKVVSSSLVGIGGKKFTIINDEGCEQTVHESYFYPVTKENLLPSKQQPAVEDDSFEGLVYKQPVQNSYIDVDTISEDQLEYFNNHVGWDDEDRIGNEYPVAKFIVDDDNTWIATEIWNMHRYKQVFFNDIFVKED